MKDYLSDLLKACSSYEQLLDRLLSCIQHAVLLADHEGHIRFASPAAAKTLGFTPDELMQKSLSVLFTPEDLSELYPNLLYLARKNKPFEGELLLIRRNRTRFFAYCMLQTCLDPETESILIFFSIQDIDRVKQLEMMLKEIHYDDLVKVANGIAHELRNPLVTVGGFVNRLYRSCEGTQDQGKFHEYILGNLRKIEALVSKVTFFARLPKPSFTEQTVDRLVQNALEPHREVIEKRRIQLSVVVGDTRLFADTELVVKALSVLIENALDALTEGGKLVIESEKVGNEYKIRITDTGSGISEQDLPRLFDPFFSTKPTGIGLDLMVAKRIMASHNGKIHLQSNKGGGTTSVVTFPLERRRSIRTTRMWESEGGYKP
jgi:PAS domain S-box-containing protein